MCLALAHEIINVSHLLPRRSISLLPPNTLTLFNISLFFVENSIFFNKTIYDRDLEDAIEILSISSDKEEEKHIEQGKPCFGKAHKIDQGHDKTAGHLLQERFASSPIFNKDIFKCGFLSSKVYHCVITELTA